MKKFAIVLVMMIAGAANAQQTPVPQVTVQGEGVIKVKPDMATITIGVNNEGNDAKEVKKENDKATDAVIKYLKKAGIDAKDHQTERVYLNRNYDYDKKKYYYKASQTISVKLKDLSKYDDLITGLTEAGVNNIQGVNFESSEQKKYEVQARIEAMLDAKKKAEDYASAIGQSIGAAMMINESGSSYTPPVRMAMAMSAEMDTMGSRETLAVGEIEVRAKVTVGFALKL